MKIENEEQYKEALERIDVLLDTVFTVQDSLQIEALTDAIEVYENKHHPIPEPTFSLEDMIAFAKYCDFHSYGASEIDTHVLDEYLGSK